jgi:hypothetical protein
MSTPGWLRLSILPVVAVVGGLLSGCGSPPTTSCPTTVEEAVADAGLDGTGTTLVAVARVIRFVPSPDDRARGYDLDLARAVVGHPSDSGLFLRLHDPIPGLERGTPVLVTATMDSQNPVLLTPNRCPPLQAISESEFVRWAGEQ